MAETTQTPSRTPDPAFTGRFTFQVDGVVIGSFTEVSGLSVQMDVEELVEGGQNGYVHRLPGRLKWPNLVLKRGVTDSDALFAWLWSTQESAFGPGGGTPSPWTQKGQARRSNGSVELRDSRGTRVRRWDVDGAYPVKWTGPKLAAASNELAVEELEISHRGFRPAT